VQPLARRQLEWPRIRALPAAAALAIFISGAEVQAWTLDRALAPDSPYLFVFFFSGALAAWAALPLVHMTVLNAPLPWQRPLRFLAIHSLGYAGFAIFSVLFGSVVTESLFYLLSLHEPRRTLIETLLFEVQNSGPVYGGFALLWTAYEVSRRHHAASLRATRLETQLTTVRLDTLRARIAPQLLSARLGEARVAMTSDLALAERMVEQLGSELRTTLATDTPFELTSISVGPTQGVAFEGSRLRTKHVVWALALSICFSLLSGGALKHALAEPSGEPYSLALARALSLWLALPLPYYAVRLRPDPRGRWLTYLGVHLIGQVGFILAMTSVELLCASRPLQHLLSGDTRDAVSFGDVLMLEHQRTSQLYVAALALFTAIYYWQRQRNEEQRAARLEATLAVSQLDALTARLEPHFLYNALNTIVALMHMDLQLSERLVGDLDQLLAAASADGAATWSLTEECAHAARYAAFVEARFGDRITVCWQHEVAAEADAIQVPRFALQLLLENAIKHNQESCGALTVNIASELRREQLWLTVSDSGRGFDPSPSKRAGGLERLAQMLTLLHGERASLERGTSELGGARVQLRIPFASGWK
jgi:hypothetical protein